MVHSDALFSDSTRFSIWHANIILQRCWSRWVYHGDFSNPGLFNPCKAIS